MSPFRSKSRRSVSHVVLMGSILLLTVTLTACGSSRELQLAGETTGAAEQPADNVAENPPGTQLHESDMEAIADEVYDSVFSGQRVTPLLLGIFSELDLSVLDPDDDMDEIRIYIADGTPFIASFQLELIADGFEHGLMIDLESFVDEINAKGFRTTDGSGEVTLGYLTDRLAYIVEVDDPAEDDRRVALALALGRDRAARLGVNNPDPVWGDDRLDPLQITLLYYERLDISAGAAAVDYPHVFASSITALLPSSFSAPLPNPLLGILAGGYATTRDIICTSVILYSHRAELTLEPEKIYRKAAGSELPSESTASFKLRFDFVPYSPSHLEVLDYLMCGDLPANGLRDDVRVEWKILETLAPGSLGNSGKLTEWLSRTNEEGVATTTFVAFDEPPLPEPFWGRVVENGGSIVGTAKGLVEYSLLRLVLEADPRSGEGKWIATSNLNVSYHIGAGTVDMKLTVNNINFTWKDGKFIVLEDGTIDGQGVGTITGTAHCVAENYSGPVFDVTGSFTFDVGGKIIDEAGVSFFDFKIPGKVADISFSYDDPKCAGGINEMAKWVLTQYAENVQALVPNQEIRLRGEDGETIPLVIPDVGTLVVQVSKAKVDG